MNQCMAAAWAVCSGLALSGVAVAGSQQNFPFVIRQDIGVVVNGTELAGSYQGPVTVTDFSIEVTDARGAVDDGGYDAYDGAGYIVPGAMRLGNGPSGVSISRRADALTELNIYRWLDTYTNTTERPISIDLAFYTNLGSDGDDQILENNSFRLVTSEISAPKRSDVYAPTDPVVAMMHGNNDWAATNITVTKDIDIVRRRFVIDLAPGASATLMFADFLAYTPTLYEGEGGEPIYADPGTIGDVQLALSRSADLIADPSVLFDGIDTRGLGPILNWTIPSPGAAAVGALAGLAALRRRRA